MKMKLFPFPMGTAIFGITAVFSLVMMTACTHKNSNADEKVSEKYCLTDSLLKKISFDIVKVETVTNELTLSGTITFNEDKVVKVYPQASGHVQEVKVSLGDYVEKGQVLVEIQSSDMANISNEFISSQSDLAIAKKNLDAAEDMHKSGLLSEKEYTEALQNHQKALSSLNKSKEVMLIYGNSSGGENTSGYVIKAPISGFIVEKNVNTGMEIRSDANENLFTISDLKEVWAIANVYETDIEKIKIGDGAIISTLSYGEKSFNGKIDKIRNVLNPDTKVLNIKIRLDNADYLLKPGMFAKVKISYPDNKKMLTISKNSLVFDENKNYVVVYKNKCDMNVVQIISSKTVGDKVYVEAKLKEGDKIITDNGLFVFYALKNF